MQQTLWLWNRATRDNRHPHTCSLKRTISASTRAAIYLVFQSGFSANLVGGLFSYSPRDSLGFPLGVVCLGGCFGICGELGLYGNGPLERWVAGLAPQIINRQTALSRCGENVGPAPKDELNTNFNNYCFMLNSMNHTTWVETTQHPTVAR
jgi:hypothetical protein